MDTAHSLIRFTFNGGAHIDGRGDYNKACQPEASANIFIYMFKGAWGLQAGLFFGEGKSIISYKKLRSERLPFSHVSCSEKEKPQVVLEAG